MTGSHTHPRVEYRLLPARNMAGRWLGRMLGMQRQLRDAEIRERVECNRKSGETPACGDRYRHPPRRGRDPATADNGRTDPVTAVNGPDRGTRWLRGEGVPGQ